ncbi:GNAT family N-acetyltransferase [Zooshikella harenae]|uniref:GNAT family N-acetyltransferase n=1 Tax=Zooshikella harenae TaxID=2827238 RepID=A0ABS5ZGT4_9GAMM|nr:GNAT family N-acetyltransferase [Zooshikella harenae]MBU2713185.1 GNAT family N-acetyltransferase [Zooshikella harenae]
MVVLRDMRQEEYSAYCQYFIDDYSKEIVVNYGHSMELAIELAKKDLKRCFPKGLEDSEHTLLCIDAEIKGKSSLVGYLWHSVNASENSTFIYDFYISSEHRSQGFGKQAISALEKQLQLAGINQIKLRVAYRNERALKLYKEVGFVITGFNMSKTILAL